MTTKNPPRRPSDAAAVTLVLNPDEAQVLERLLDRVTAWFDEPTDVLLYRDDLDAAERRVLQALAARVSTTGGRS